MFRTTNLQKHRIQHVQHCKVPEFEQIEFVQIENFKNMIVGNFFLAFLDFQNNLAYLNPLIRVPTDPQNAEIMYIDVLGFSCNKIAKILHSPIVPNEAE